MSILLQPSYATAKKFRSLESRLLTYKRACLECLRPKEVIIVVRAEVVLRQWLKCVPVPDQHAVRAYPHTVARLKFLLTTRAGAHPLSVGFAFEPHRCHRAFASITNVVTPMKTGNVCMGENCGTSVKPAIERSADGTSTHLANV